ncbi:AraC-like DNA-binding protein [Catenuloplanes nepalensis]|uniref:AraC-like DNA-binding protein n=1 Tax=Catenuloplanes nepalensis TaxID=587533 RepID=A0ABT9MRN3_9ACTN|nr:AraC family transcriptional regulator [Catenuloplanes nepalensis]MDP9794084.1 AraC-like DNA-binding protein [Catenuloplanes nepalensis]
MDLLDDVVGALRLGRVHTALWVVEDNGTADWPDTAHVAGFRLAVAGQAQIDLSGGPVLTLAPGDLAFFPRGSAHRVSVPPGSGGASLICGAYDIEDTWRHPLLADLPDVYVVRSQATSGRRHEAQAPPLGGSPSVGTDPDVHHEHREGGASTRALTQVVVDEITRSRPGRDTMLGSLLDLLMLSVLRAWLSSSDATGWASALRDPVLAPVLRAMHERPEQVWTVAGLATEAAMSRSGFARRFTDIVGVPPLEYLTRWRMQLAAQRLRSDDAPVRSIAAQVGYTSEFAFSRAFARNQGVPPATYRRRYRDGVTTKAATTFTVT